VDESFSVDMTDHQFFVERMSSVFSSVCPRSLSVTRVSPLVSESSGYSFRLLPRSIDRRAEVVGTESPHPRMKERVPSQTAVGPPSLLLGLGGHARRCDYAK